MVGHGQLTLYRDCRPVIDEYHNTNESQSIVETLTTALAAAEGIDVTELQPLYETIDLDAVEQLFEGHDGGAKSGAILGFEYNGWNVFIRADGRVRVCDGTRQSEPAPVFTGETA